MWLKLDSAADKAAVQIMMLRLLLDADT